MLFLFDSFPEKKATIDIGPVLPRNIAIIIMIRPIGLSAAVRFLDKPTVPQALTTSNKASSIGTGLNTDKSAASNRVANTLTYTTAAAFRIESTETRLLKMTF